MARIAALILPALILLACTALPPRARLPAAPGSKPVSFVMLEDYVLSYEIYNEENTLF